MSETKNLGQVSGLFIGATPPVNLKLIWYDNTPSQEIHKAYNTGTSQWEAIDKFTVLGITYAELVTLASTTGLTIGKYFQITDRNNSLATSITQTKIQYTDLNGNIVIDDLGSNIEYIVSSSNLIIDDIQGVFDLITKRVVFTFTEEPAFGPNDYIFGKGIRSGVSKLLKWKSTKIVSEAGANSLSWNNGVYFNFSGSLSSLYNVAGGIVSYNYFLTQFSSLENDINNVAANYQALVDSVNQSIDTGLSATNVYSKQLPTTLDVAGEPVDIAMGDSLTLILTKIQRYINKFKFTTGIRISPTFSDATTPLYINNNDTAESAFGKLQYWIKRLQDALYIFLAPGYQIAPIDSVHTVSAGDSVHVAISKLDSKLIQLGDAWQNGSIRKSLIPGTGTFVTDFSTSTGQLIFSGKDSYLNHVTTLYYDGLITTKPNSFAGVDYGYYFADWLKFGRSGSNNTFSEVGINGIKTHGPVHVSGIPMVDFQNFGTGIISARLSVEGNQAYQEPDPSSEIVAGIVAKYAGAYTSAFESVDGYFGVLKTGGRAGSYRFNAVGNLYLTNEDYFVHTRTGTPNNQMFLPNRPIHGQKIYILHDDVDVGIYLVVRGNGKTINSGYTYFYLPPGRVARMIYSRELQTWNVYTYPVSTTIP